MVSYVTHIFSNPGTYNVGSMVGISGANGCSDTAWVQVVVLPSPDVSISADNINGCDTMTVNYSSVTANTVSWDWTFEVAPFTYSGQNPPAIFYDSPGNYNVRMVVQQMIIFIFMCTNLPWQILMCSIFVKAKWRRSTI